jgi:hypothetical protein
MALTATERSQRYRARNPNRRAKPENVKLKAEGKNPNGWLIEDGIVDHVAIDLVVSGERCPDLTFNEALLATEQLMKQTKGFLNVKDDSLMSAEELISFRLGCSRKSAVGLMNVMRKKRKAGVL